MLTSVELAPPVNTVTAGGRLKSLREPVIVILGETRTNQHLSCAVIFTHAGLMPGVYELNDGTRVRIPHELVGDTHRTSYSVTLEAPK